MAHLPECALERCPRRTPPQTASNARDDQGQHLPRAQANQTLGRNSVTENLSIELLVDALLRVRLNVHGCPGLFQTRHPRLRPQILARIQVVIVAPGLEESKGIVHDDTPQREVSGARHTWPELQRRRQPRVSSSSFRHRLCDGSAGLKAHRPAAMIHPMTLPIAILDRGHGHPTTPTLPTLQHMEVVPSVAFADKQFLSAPQCGGTQLRHVGSNERGEILGANGIIRELQRRDPSILMLILLNGESATVPVVPGSEHRIGLRTILLQTRLNCTSNQLRVRTVGETKRPPRYRKILRRLHQKAWVLTKGRQRRIVHG